MSKWDSKLQTGVQYTCSGIKVQIYKKALASYKSNMKHLYNTFQENGVPNQNHYSHSMYDSKVKL